MYCIMYVVYTYIYVGCHGGHDLEMTEKWSPSIRDDPAAEAPFPKGTVGMVAAEPNSRATEVFITLAEQGALTCGLCIHVYM